MTQEEKQLLLKDLCARLPYGVKCVFHSNRGEVASTIVKIDIDNETVSHRPDGQSLIYFHFIVSGEIKPYLRPISSMTEEEKEDFGVPFTSEGLVTLADTVECIDWLNKHHFDYRGLIEKGLALEAPEGIYKTE
ncbi:MAG: hypothetical protein J5658_03885 [Prevotella sp.]|nr:hypothetical protein [Prevotella sp.]